MQQLANAEEAALLMAQADATEWRRRMRPPVLVADADVIGTHPAGPGGLTIAKIRAAARAMDEAPRLCWVCNEYEVRAWAAEMGVDGLVLPTCETHRSAPPAMIPPSPSGADASWRRGVWA